MNTIKRIVILSSILVAGLSASACDDATDATCVENTLKCRDDATLLLCTNGSYVTKELCKSGQVCDVDACVEKLIPECKHSHFVNSCADDKTLNICTTNGKLSTKTCANGCKDGACVDEAPECSHSDYVSTCADDKTLNICTTNGKLSTLDCANGCNDGACVCTRNDPTTCIDIDTISFCNEETGKFEEKDCEFDCRNNACASRCSSDIAPFCEGNKLLTCNDDRGKLDAKDCPHGCFDGACLEAVVDNCDPACVDAEVCRDGTCVDRVAETAIGQACSCAGDDCEIVINGEEIKGLLQLPIAFGELTEADKITAPNFFATGINGCENVVAPQGMTVGCFRNSKISVDKSITDEISTLMASLGDLLGDIPEGMQETLGSLLGAGIPFASPYGYCLSAAIDIKASIDGTAAEFLSEENLDKFIGKIATGKHSHAAAAACPVGSSKFTYTINASMDGFGHFGIGFDLCLKSCASKDDCRDGYDCIEIPDGVPSEGQTTDDLVKKSVCFDKANVDYFTQLTEQFSPAPAE